jgi:hypothetical protein
VPLKAYRSAAVGPSCGTRTRDPTLPFIILADLHFLRIFPMLAWRSVARLRGSPDWHSPCGRTVVFRFLSIYIGLVGFLTEVGGGRCQLALSRFVEYTPWHVDPSMPIGCREDDASMLDPSVYDGIVMSIDAAV